MRRQGPSPPRRGRRQSPSPRGATCHDGMSFDRFLADLKQKAAAAGVSPQAIAEASPDLVYDQGIVNRDRGQRVFGQVFTQFAGRMAAPYRMQQGQARIKTYAAAFARAEKEYGVPPAVIAAFWGLESDFGANMGNLPTLRSLVSLAYDCRRSEMFANETIAALKIIDRGDLSPSEMVGSWAGELGQTQFLPTHYFNYAVDYDGDGRRDLLTSRRDRLDRELHRQRAEMASRRTVAGGNPAADGFGVRFSLGPDRPLDSIAALEMGAARRELSGRPRAAERRHADRGAVANGPQWAGVPRLCQFRRLHRVE